MQQYQDTFEIMAVLRRLIRENIRDNQSIPDNILNNYENYQSLLKTLHETDYGVL